MQKIPVTGYPTEYRISSFLIKGKQVWKFNSCLNVIESVWKDRKVIILPCPRFIEFDHIIKPKPVIMKHIPTSKDLNDLPGWSILIHSQ